MRHIYRVYFKDNRTQDYYSKKELVSNLNTIDKNSIQKIEWYKSNGFWVDMTKQYITQ